MDPDSYSWAGDKVKLGEAGWKQRYYKEKFQAITQQEQDEVKKDLVLKYTEGLSWVLHYYYQGVCSWQWFYPYHYAPFASDLTNLHQLKIEFSLGAPFKPFDQLMGVLPAASAAALPEQYRRLMTDPQSPIIGFYPRSFEIDMNGKRLAWQGVAKLPFIEESRLLAETNKLEESLTEAEHWRNSQRPDMLVVESHHRLGECIQMIQKHQSRVETSLNPEISEGMNGYVRYGDADIWTRTVISPIGGLPDITENQVFSASYRLPDTHKHVSKLADGVIIPEKTIKEQDLKMQPLWLEQGINQLPLERPPVPDSIAGPELGNAAFRLLNKNSPSIMEKTLSLIKKGAEQPFISVDSIIEGCSKHPAMSPKISSPKMPRPAPAGPPGYEGGFSQAPTVASRPFNSAGSIIRGRYKHPPRSRKKSSPEIPQTAPAGPPGCEGGLSPAQTVGFSNYIFCRGLHDGRSPNGLSPLPIHNIDFVMHHHPCPLGEMLSQKTKLHQRSGVNALCQQGRECCSGRVQKRHQPHQFSRQQVNFFVRCRKMLW